MCDRVTIKKHAKEDMKYHYFRNVFVAFICFVILSGGYNLGRDKAYTINYSKLNNTPIVNKMGEIEEGYQKIEQELKDKYKNGVIAYLINETDSNGSFTYTIFNGINKLIFSEKISTGIIILISGIVFWTINIIFFKVIEIGKNRYFLEKRRYYDTKIERIMFPYKVKKTFHLAYILFLKFIYQILWCFSIYNIIPKYYEYKMIPYILAENPNISKKDAFRLSKSLSDGEKLNMFKMDLSLIGYQVLNLVTLGISKIFYSDVYINFIYAEYYMNLRKKVNDKLLNDEALDIEYGKHLEYPYIQNKKFINIDYNKNYDLLTYILFFFTFSCFGWIWEVFLEFVKSGNFVNRGTMYGPWLPVYGWGGILILLLLKKYRDKPALLFFLAFTLCGIVEYLTSIYLEYVVGLEYWNYSGYFLNINGRICLEGLILFGLGGVGFTYIFAPILDDFYKKINKTFKIILASILICGYLIDLSYTHEHPNSGSGITSDLVIQKSKNVLTNIKEKC